MFYRAPNADAMKPCPGSLDVGCVYGSDCNWTSADGFCRLYGGSTCRTNGYDCVQWPFGGCTIFGEDMTIYCNLT